MDGEADDACPCVNLAKAQGCSGPEEGKYLKLCTLAQDKLLGLCAWSVLWDAGMTILGDIDTFQ